MSRIYISAIGERVIAGPAVVSTAYFFSSLSPFFPSFSSSSRSRHTLLSDACDFLLTVPREYYYIKYKVIPTYEINRYGYTHCVSRAGRSLAYTIQNELDLPNTELWLTTTKEVMGSLYENYHRLDIATIESYWLDTYCKYIQMHWMQTADEVNPLYNWKDNYGWGTYQHLSRLLYHGPDLRFHRLCGLKGLAKHWLALIDNNDLWAMTRPWMRQQPDWWKTIYPNLPFTHWLTTNEMYELHKSMTRCYPVQFRNWLRKEGAAAKFPQSLIELSVDTLLDVPTQQTSLRKPTITQHINIEL